eukprot:IDg14505t1
MVEWTNVQLSRRCVHVTSVSELLRFIGVLVLLTRFKFGCRRSMWATTSKFKYIAAPNFAAIIPRIRFEMLRYCILFSNCYNGDDEGMNRWNLVDDFATAINKHRAEFVSPSDLIYVDESMSRWYGLGGDWINIGCLPTGYRSKARK